MRNVKNVCAVLCLFSLVGIPIAVALLSSTDDSQNRVGTSAPILTRKGGLIASARECEQLAAELRSLSDDENPLDNATQHQIDELERQAAEYRRLAATAPD